MKKIRQRRFDPSKRRCDADPGDTAMHFRLISAIALLEVSQVLLNQSSDHSPQDQERQWKTLVTHTNTADRSASIVTD